MTAFKTATRVGLVAMATACGLYGGPVQADPVSGTLYYTTFSGGVNVHKVDFNYNGTSFSLSSNTNLASTSGADGLLFAPNGNLLVAGQGNNLTEVTPAGAIVGTIAPGGPSFHLALTSNAPNALIYNLGNGGCGNTCISAATLSGGGISANGVAYTVSGAFSLDVRGLALDPTTGIWYYGTAPDGGAGDFGTVVFNNATHTATLTRLLTGVFAHGLTFDPFTGDIIMSSAGTIQQFHPATGTIISTASGAGNFDQSAVDGNGHLFLASNSGNLDFIDYDATGLIGAAGDFHGSQFLAFSLDDIAPLSGIGSHVPEPGTLALVGLALFGLGASRRRSA